MSAGQSPKITPAEYLAADRSADHRSEYVDGEMFARSGGSRVHAALISRVAREFEDALEESPCEVTVTDLRLQVSQEGAIFIPT